MLAIDTPSPWLGVGVLVYLVAAVIAFVLLLAGRVPGRRRERRGFDPNDMIGIMLAALFWPVTAVVVAVRRRGRSGEPPGDGRGA